MMFSSCIYPNIQRRVLPQLNQKKTAAIKANGSLKSNSLKLVMDEKYSAVFYLTFVFESEVENFVTIYFMAKELVNKETDQIAGFEPDGKQPTKTSTFQSGEVVEFKYGISFLDTSHYEQE